MERTKNRARARVAVAIKTGKLIRPTECPKCGSTKRIQGHHEDYKKPLEVEWICELCHRHLHIDKDLQEADKSSQKPLRPLKRSDLEAMHKEFIDQHRANPLTKKAK